MSRAPSLPKPAADIFRRLEAVHLKQVDLASALGIEPNKVSKVKAGERRFTGEELDAARAWLAEQERAAEHSLATSPDIPPTRLSDEEVVELSRLDLSFSMGTGTEIDDYVEETPVRFDLAFLRQITRTPPNRLRLARGIGDSMFPTLLSSDNVMIDTTQRTLNLGDRIYAISLFGAAAIKRLRPIGPTKVLVVSDNPAVQDQEIDAEDLVIAGRIIWFARDL